MPTVDEAIRGCLTNGEYVKGRTSKLDTVATRCTGSKLVLMRPEAERCFAGLWGRLKTWRIRAAVSSRA
ncbi:MAG: hypothetical protein GY772_27870 [bacterium]|nr:hypothetical protein [bacterium]